MGYANLAECVLDLEKNGQLVRIDEPLDPNLELAHVQRRAFAAQSPALLFTRPKGCKFPMLANLYGTRERVNFIFRDTLENTQRMFQAAADLKKLLKNPTKLLAMAPCALHMRPKHIPAAKAPVLAHKCGIEDLPKLVSWPGDGGPFITLPQVYSEDPKSPHSGNLGMYRAQLAGNDYGTDEIGLHYQTLRGIGAHHAHALEMGMDLPVNIHVGGPPALALSAVMPMPEGMSELMFAGLLGGRRIELAAGGKLPVLAHADFVIQGAIGKKVKPEGPFGDHLGYYSLKHDFPCLKAHSVHHSKNAIWPFTSVGRPPQEDTIFGDLIHELTAPMLPRVFPGISQAHAVDAAGVHPLLLAIGSERYTPYEAARKPRELITQAMHLLGATQTALAKFVLIAAREDNPQLNARNAREFLAHMLERSDFANDLHFITRSGCDTLDYSGYGLHEGSRLIWAAAGEKRRTLGQELRDAPGLPAGFSNPRLAAAGILVLQGPAHAGGRLDQDGRIGEELAEVMAHWPHKEAFPLVAVVDDADFCSASFANFLWAVFTRTDPARDIYGAKAKTTAKHWQCGAPLIMDARLKSFQARPLEDDPAVKLKIDKLATKNGPLYGLI